MKWWKFSTKQITKVAHCLMAMPLMVWNETINSYITETHSMKIPENVSSD
jgi:hypothetical protein